MASDRGDPVPDDDWILTPIVPCARCGRRYVEDPYRDGRGDPIPLLPGEEERDPPECEECQREAFYEALEADVLEMLERKLGLKEEDKKTFQALKSIIENPDRVIMVARVHDRVDELERRLEDRYNSLRDNIESKMENAQSRLFVSSLITNAALFVAGTMVGIVFALVLGG